MTRQSKQLAGIERDTALGAAANFMTSLPASVFGRHSFDVVYSIYFPIMQVVLMLNYIVNSMALRITGSLRGAYVVFIALLIINLVLLGRLSHYFGLPEEAWMEAIEAIVPAKFLELNKKAFYLGRNQ